MFVFDMALVVPVEANSGAVRLLHGIYLFAVSLICLARNRYFYFY